MPYDTDAIVLILLLASAAVVALVYFTGGIPAIYKYFDTIPTLAQYAAAHPGNVQGQRVTCFKCQHAEILDIGLTRYADFRRKHICAHCKQLLFRDEAG
ncbi:hypothetical protein JCM19000A_32230 [Silvimonas sp. JCM 19000]